MANRVCAEPGCPNLTPCPTHTRAPWTGSRRRDRIGKTGWQIQADARRILRRHHNICHICGQPGATQVDHVVPIGEGGTDDDTNKRPIHPHPCHTNKTAAEAARARARRRSTT